MTKKVKESESVPTLIRKLRNKGLLLLARPYFATRTDGNTAAVSPWDRLAIRLAVAHLLSWESWVLNSAKEHQKRIDDVETFKRRIPSEKIVASSTHEENMKWNGWKSVPQIPKTLEMLRNHLKSPSEWCVVGQT